MDPQNLTDRAFIILRAGNFKELTFQEFRSQYATQYNVMNPPERAKLMKLPIVKVSYSQKHKKQTMKILIEKDYLCDNNNNNDNNHDNNCCKLHVLNNSDICSSFRLKQTCTNSNNCIKLHIPHKSLYSRTIQVFKQSSRSRMPFSKFIVLHRTTFPYLRKHHPTNDILSDKLFNNLVRIENTDKTKEISLIIDKEISSGIDAPYPALKIIQFDNKWIDTENLINDIIKLFNRNRIKDIFIPGHMRMAFVTFNTAHNANKSVKKFNNTWFYGRKVNVSLSNRNTNNDNDEEKVSAAGYKSNRVVIKAINNVIKEKQINSWMNFIGGITKISICFVKCMKSSDVCYVHFKSSKVINEILNNNNIYNKFRNKQIKLMKCDDGYTDSSTYYSLKRRKSSTEKKNNNHIDIDRKIKAPPQLKPSLSMPSVSAKSNDTDKKNDSMQLLVMRLKLLINNTISTQNDIQNKLKVLSVIDGVSHNNNNNNNNDIDIDIAFGNEKYTIDALRESLESIKNDKKQIQVYKQALTAFETSQSRSIHKNQRELKPISDKEIRLAKNLNSVNFEICELQKKLLLKQNEQKIIKKDLDITRKKVKKLRKKVSQMKIKIEPIRECLNTFDLNTHSMPNQDVISSIEGLISSTEINISHWLKWDKWSLSDATQWISQLENGKFSGDINKFNALNKISTGSILNAITDPTLQIIGISSSSDRKCIINNIALLKSRTAMMKKSLRKYKQLYNKKLLKISKLHARRSSLNTLNTSNKLNADKLKKYGLDDLVVQDIVRQSSHPLNKSDTNLCVICLDRDIAPFAMVPCGHQCLCNICKALIKPNKHKCPMCNGNVQMIIKLFRA